MAEFPQQCPQHLFTAGFLRQVNDRGQKVRFGAETCHLFDAKMEQPILTSRRIKATHLTGVENLLLQQPQPSGQISPEQRRVRRCAFCAVEMPAVRQIGEIQDSDGLFTERLAVHPAQHGNLDMQDFRRALDRLADDQREAIILVGASGFSYEEAAVICGCALGTIKSCVNRARNRLQELLQVSGEQDYGPAPDTAAITNRAFAG